MNYSISEHSLSFTNNFSSIEVQNTANGQVCTYPLDQDGKAVCIEVNGGNYQVESQDIPVGAAEIKLAIDTGKDPEFSFQGDNLEGTVIIDLRDIGRLAETDMEEYSGCANLEFDMRGNPIFFWEIAGPKALKFYFENENAFAVTAQ